MEKGYFKGAVSVISSDRACKDDNFRFTTVPLKPLKPLKHKECSDHFCKEITNQN